MGAVFEFIAVLAALHFSGAAIYISLVEHPARMACGTELAATVFGPSYRRAVLLQVSLALAAATAGVAVWSVNGPVLWVIGAMLTFAVIPFTVVAIAPTNRWLLSPEVDRASAATHRLLLRWGKLHAVRGALGFAASVVFLSLVIWS